MAATSKPILVKKSFNGGELSPELHYRDDLAAYVKGCKHLDNMQATPYGAVTRRPPMELMAKIDTALYGVPVKYIPFKFSLTEVFNIVFTDGSGSESPDSSTADFMVFDDEGSLVILEGTTGDLTVIPATLPAILSSGFEALESTPYDPADLVDLHFINVNDYVYMTCGGKYPLTRINRFYDSAADANRWRIEESPVNGGPFDTTVQAGTTGDRASFFVDVWDVGTSYSAGDIVQEGYSEQILGYNIATVTASRVRTHDDGVSEFTVEVGVNVAWAQVGFNIYLRNVWFSNVTEFDRENPLYYDRKARDIEGVSLSGWFTVESMLGNVATLSARIYRNVTNQPTFTYNAAGRLGAVYTNLDKTVAGTPYRNSRLYRALGNTTGNSPLVSPTQWEFAEALTPDDSIHMDINRKPSQALGVGQLVNIKNAAEAGSFSWVHNPGFGATDVFVTTSFAFLSTATMTTAGSWTGALLLEESVDYGSTWVEIGQITSSTGSFNGSIERNPSSSHSFMRLRVSAYSGLDPLKFAQAFLEMKLSGARLYESTGSIKSITDVDTGQYVVSASNHINNSITYKLAGYALGVWGGGYGYPHTLTIHDERLILGGSQSKPNTVFASSVNDWENFIAGSLETSPYSFTIASDSFDTIRSMKSSRQLNIMTDNQEITMGSRDDNAVTSILNVAVSSHTNYGSSHVQAVQMADMIWFAMGQGRRVRASRYDFASDGQQSIEMSLFANHITESGIKEMSFRRHPYNTLFCVLENGTAASFTYEGAQEVQAWSPITTEGTIVSAYANYSDMGDVVNGIVERNGFYYLEKFGSNDESTIYLDNFVHYEDKDFTLGVPLEQGYTDNLVVIDCQDRQLVEGVDYTITAGVLTIPGGECATVTVGIPFTSRVNPTDVTEFGANGSTRRLSALALYLLGSGDCVVRINGKDSNFTDGSRLADGERLTGRFEMTTGGGFAPGLDVDILVADHKPFTLTGLGFRMTVTQ